MKRYVQEMEAIKKWFYEKYDGIKFTFYMYDEPLTMDFILFECRFQGGNVTSLFISGTKEYEFDYASSKIIYEDDLEQVKKYIDDSMNWIIGRHKQYEEKIRKVKHETQVENV